MAAVKKAPLSLTILRRCHLKQPGHNPSRHFFKTLQTSPKALSRCSFLVFGLLFFLVYVGQAHAVESAGNVTFTTNQALGQNGDYPFAGIYIFDNLTIGDNVEITSTGISQLVIKVNGRLTFGRNAVIRVRNGYYPEAPVNLITNLNVTSLTTKGVLTPEGARVYVNMFGKGGNGGDNIDAPNCGGGGGGFGGGIGGLYQGLTRAQSIGAGEDNGGGGGYLYHNYGGTGGGSIDLAGPAGYKSTPDSKYYGGGGGNGGDSAKHIEQDGRISYLACGGGGYGGGVLTIIANTILIVDSSAPPKILVSGQKAGVEAKALPHVLTPAENGQGGLLIIQNAGWNYPDGRSVKQAWQHLWNLNADTYGEHIWPSTNGGHGIVTGNPQKVFVNGMEIPYVEVTGILLDKTELNLTAGGDPGTLIHTLSPLDATVQEVIWSIDKPEVASITEVDGLAYKIIEPLSDGTATVTVTSIDGTYSAKAMVYVGTVAKPTFSIAEGTYDSVQTVNITSSTADASIRYTIDGSDPSPTVGTELTNGSGVIIASTQTLKAIAYNSELLDSDIASASYTINGSLIVNIGPSGLVPTARWRVDGGAWQTTGSVVVGLSAGNHVVDYLDIEGGWYKPAIKTILIASGELLTIAGKYSMTPPTSSLTVSIAPPEVVTAGAKWRVSGEGWNDSGITLEGLSIGTKVVEFSDVHGWTKPNNQEVIILQDELTAATGAYTAITYTQVQLDQAVSEAVLDANAAKDQIIAQKDQSIATLTATITDKNQTITNLNDTITVKNQIIASMFTQAQLDTAVANAVAPKDQLIAQKDQEIATLNQEITTMFTQAQLDTAVANAVAPKDQLIAQKDQEIATLNQEITTMFTQAQLDTAVANAVAPKDQLIAQKDQEIATLNQEITTMFTQAQLDTAVANAVLEAVALERLKWDVGDDQRIGLEEAIRALQVLSGER